MNVVWPWVLCARCCAFPGEPCRVGEAGVIAPVARAPHKVRIDAAHARDVELRAQGIFDLAEFRRRKAS